MAISTPGIPYILRYVFMPCSWMEHAMRAATTQSLRKSITIIPAIPRRKKGLELIAEGITNNEIVQTLL
ncbi:MAG TPA: hypothetical protein VK645_17255 [Chitinophagaceae bacterium]|nr:hypothetical protein [Chitinophagaceae bacterium]